MYGLYPFPQVAKGHKIKKQICGWALNPIQDGITLKSVKISYNNTLYIYTLPNEDPKIYKLCETHHGCNFDYVSKIGIARLC